MRNLSKNCKLKTKNWSLKNWPLLKTENWKLKTVFILFALLLMALPAWAETPYETLWTRQMGTSIDDEAYGVAVDSSGNAYVAGRTYSGLDGNTFAGGITDLFLVKYNTNGTKL